MALRVQRQTDLQRNVLKEVRLDIGGIVISVVSHNLDLTYLQGKSYYQDFLTKREPEIVLRVHYSYSPKCNFKERAFDTNSLWKLYYEDSKHILWLGPSESPFPDRLVFFDPDFKSGDIYVFPTESNKNLLLNPLHYPLDQLLMVNLLSKGRGITIHACGIIDHENGIIFAGKSEAGKSTIANLWKGRGRVTILSDDRIIIRKIDGRFWMYGTPWHGDAKVCSPEKAPLEKIFVLKHAKKNKVKKMSPIDATSRLIVCSFPTFWNKKGMDFTLNFCAELAGQVPCYELGFLPDKGVIDLIKSI